MKFCMLDLFVILTPDMHSNPATYRVIVLERKILFGNNFFLVIVESPFTGQNVAPSDKLSLVHVS